MKEIKGFLVRDDLIDNNNNIISPIFELSDYSSTYAKEKQRYVFSTDSVFSLYVFKNVNASLLSQLEADSVINVLKAFSLFLENLVIVNKQQTIISFVSNYNLLNPTQLLTNFTYNLIEEHNLIKTGDYVSFIINNEITCNIWMSDVKFKNLYPDYEVNIVLPFINFNTIINNPSDFISAINSFNLIDFNAIIETNKGEYPTTYSKILNIPYKVPNSTITKNCYFAFNIYGQQGNYDYILKLELYNYLINVVGLTGTDIQNLFPTILNINEFFLTPRWDKIAIPSYVGSSAINSQMSLAYNEPYDLNKFIKIYSDADFVKANTYALPIDYNNLLMYITNGFYSEEEFRDFKLQYNDFITVLSTHPDFSRMSTKTQHFVTLLINMLVIADSETSTDMFNKILQNTDYVFKIITRDNVVYLTIFHEKHQLYLIPKFQFNSLL